MKTIKKTFTGRVVKIYGLIYQVEYEDDIFDCRIKGVYRKFQGIKDKEDALLKEKSQIFKAENTKNPITIGDFVKFFPVLDYLASNKGQPKNKSSKKGVITEIMSRKNKLSKTFDTPTYQSGKKRKQYNASEKTKEHLIASNIDYTLCVVSTKDPPLKTGLIDRILIASEKDEIEPVIIVNKIDLDENKELQNKVMEIYEPLGYKIFFISAKDNIGMEKLKTFVKDKIIILTGHSGVGKSSIANSILGENRIKVSDTSTFHHKGKHTTTNSELIKIPGGGYVIDTPGTKLFGLYNTDKDEILYYVKELIPFIGQCKYSSCTHTNESDCAILKAVEEGKIHSERWKNISYILRHPTKWS